MTYSSFKLWLFPEKSHSSTNKSSHFLAYKWNHFSVTPNDCRRQPLVFKQVKTFCPPLFNSPPQAPGSGSTTVCYMAISDCSLMENDPEIRHLFTWFSTTPTSTETPGLEQPLNRSQHYMHKFVSKLLALY